MITSNITVYCSASNDIDSIYLTAGEEVGKALVKNNFGIVYGGGKQGIMGTVAKTALEYNGYVLGIIPKHLVAIEQAYQEISKLVIVEDMRERKKLLQEHADAFLVMPGGFGTLDEMFEILTQKVLDIEQKPFIILNLFNFYTPLIEYLKSLQEKKFLLPHALDQFIVINSIPEMLDYLNQIFKH